MVTEQDIRQLALCNAMVHQCLQHYDRGACTLEQAMMSAVVLLAKHQEETLGEYVFVPRLKFAPTQE